MGFYRFRARGLLKSTLLTVGLYATYLILDTWYPWQWQFSTDRLSAAPDNFVPKEAPSPSPQPTSNSLPRITPVTPSPSRQPTATPVTPPPNLQTTANPQVSSPARLISKADQIAAQRAWQYFERNWNAQTGLVNCVDNYTWTTLWDQGSAILAIHAAYQLGLINSGKFQQKINRLLQTLETLPLSITGLPNKAYDTRTAQMRRLNNTVDPQGMSGWSALDTARFLMGLHVIKKHYPEYQARINRIVSRWDLSKLVKDGWLYGGIPDAQGQILSLQEGRLGYEQYAAYILKLWQIEAPKALYSPPVKTIQINGIPFQIDQRNLQNSGASNYLTNEPYLLWGLELGWTQEVKPQVLNLLKVQAKRFEQTGILTAVNEDSIDRPPYFLYYNVYADGQSWLPINVKGQGYPQFRFVSTKAAFAWSALIKSDRYTNKLRDSVQEIASNRGYFSGRYENPKVGLNRVINVNTNAIILESLLYQARGERPLAF